MGLGTVHEKEHIAGAQGGFGDDIHFIFLSAHALRHGIFGFVRAGHAGKTAVAICGFPELEGDGDAANVADAVLVVVGHIGAVGFACTVEGTSPGTIDSTDELRAVVEAESFAAHGV